MKIATRFLSVLLILCMILSLVPAVFAADGAGSDYVLATEIKDGDQIVIYNPASGNALSKEILKVYYKTGVGVTPVDGKITTSSTAIVWTVSVDGTGFNLSNDEGAKLSIDGTWNSIPYDKGNDAWTVTAATTAGCVYVVNENGKYVRWDSNYSNFGANSYAAGNEADFAMQIYVKSEGGTTEGDTVDFEFLVTSDIHGKIFATDYSSGYASSGTYRQGLTRIASYIREQKAIYGENVYTVDMGDSIQGEPLSYYYAFNADKLGVDDPTIKAFRTIGYNMWLLGNHEFNYGIDILNRQISYAVSPATETENQLVLCDANYLDANTNSAESKSWDCYENIVPYVIQDFGGVKVAIIGLSTPNIPKWDGPENWKGFYFESIYETYKHYEAEMLEKADMIVVMAHCGINNEMADASYDSVRYLVEHTDTIDFAFSGHEHGKQVALIKNSAGEEVPVLQPSTKAQAIAQVQVSYDKATGEATIVPEIKEMKEYALDEATVALLQPYETYVWENYMLTEIGKAGGDFSASNLGTAPSAFMDLINTVQIWGAYDNTGLNTPDDPSDDTPAMLSISAPLTSGNNANLINEGSIYLGDLFALYRYENWFYQLTMSGKEVRTWLEYAASKLKVESNGTVSVQGGLTYYDVIYGDGFSYVLDPTQPEGMRVTSMTYNGVEVTDDQEFTIVMNNYRYTGGGNYVKYLNEHGCDFSDADSRIIYSTQYDMIQGEDLGQARALLQAYIEKEGTINPTITSTWSVDATSTKDDITILYTNDVHTYIDGELSYDSIAALKDGYEATGKNVLLVDAGDHIQGTAYGGLDKGENIMALMVSAGYDLATLGNHEFDYGMARALEVSNAAKNGGIPYVSCNFYHEKDGVIGERVLDSYKIFEIGGKKIAFVGITTPESFTKSTPKYFQDDAGNYIYGISGGEDGAALYADVQKAIDEAKAEGVDYVIALGHLGVDPSSQPWTSEDVIANTTGLDAFIDGHSHSTVPMKEVKAKDGKTVVLTQTGSYFDAIGKMTISADGIKTELITEYYGSDAATKEIQDAWMTQVDEQLGQKIAESEIDFTTNDADGNRAVRKYETNMGNLNADAYYWFLENSGIDVDVAIMNGGGIRASAAAGDWTYKTCKTINTFGNVLCAMEVTGQQILDALEWGARQTPVAEVGGFLHTSGLTYEVDGSVTTSVQMDEKGVWTGAPTDGYRVKNVKVYNKETKAYEPIVLDKTYILAGTNYTLRDLGDGFAMFSGAKLVLDYVSEDYLAMAAYVSAFKDTDGNGYGNIASANSPLADHENFLLNYESATGAGRITVTEGVSEWDGKITIGGLEPNVWTTKYGNIYTDASAENVFEGLGFEYGDIITVKFLNQELDLPLVSNFSDVDSGMAALLVGKNEMGNPTGFAYLAINMGNFTDTYGIATKKTDADGNWYWEAKEGVTFPIELTFTMKEKGGYLAEYLLHQLSRTNSREDYSELTDEEFANFRAVTTTGMGEGILYRSSSPINPELGRNTYADKAAEAAGVKTFLNLADNQETANGYEGFSESYYSKQNIIFLNLGVDFNDDSFKAGLANGFRYMIGHDGPYLVHCTEGKDRAGYVTALLECFMGATYDEVVTDYMKTYINYYKVEAGSEQYNAIASSNIIKSLCNAFGVEDLSKADLKAGAEGYMKSIGLTDDEIAQLRVALGGGDDNTVTLELFETTDIHGYLLDTSSGDESTFQYRLAYIANVVKAARENSENDDVILLDSGDIYQGTPVSNLTYGNALRAAFDKMGYDAVSLGNHEFDWDVTTYAADKDGTMPAYKIGDYEGDSDIPVLAYNLNKAGTTDRADFVQEYTILEKGGATVAVIGYIPDYSMDIMAAKINPYAIDENLDHLNEKVDEVIEKENPDVVIVLAHTSPEYVAKAVDPEKVDVVCGGHSHQISYGVAENGVTYLQGNCQAQGYANVKINVNLETGKVTVGDPAYVKITGDKTALYDTEENADKLDAEIVAISKASWDAVKDSMNEVLGYVDQSITRRIPIGESTNTIAGNWLTGIMLRATAEQNTVAAFTNSGGIRCDLMMEEGADKRNITVGDIYTISPFGNRWYVYDITGAELAKTVENAFTNANYGDQFSGMVVTYTAEPDTVDAEGRPVRGERKVVSITLDDGTVVDITDTAKTYRVVINEYSATLPGSVFEDKTPVVDVNEAPVDNDAIIEVLRAEGKANDGKLALDLTERCVKVSVNPFSDVNEGEWFYDYVVSAAETGLVNGYEDGTFQPNGDLTRAEAVALLYRASGSPEVEGKSSFTDLPYEWYQDAIAWAEQKEIVNGVGDGKFEPNEPVSREQLVTMIWRLEGKPAAEGKLTGFEDIENVNDWAVEAFQWAVANGIINGTTFTGLTGTYLAPQDAITRAEAAKILVVYTTR